MYIRVELNLCYNHKVPASLKQAKVSGVWEALQNAGALLSLPLSFTLDPRRASLLECRVFH